jgi:hypothetical protein
MGVKDIAQLDVPFFLEEEGEQTRLTASEGGAPWSGLAIWHMHSVMESVEDSGEDRDVEATVQLSTSEVVAVLGRGPLDGDILRYQGSLTPQLQNLDLRVSRARPDPGDLTEVECAGRIQRTRLAKGGTLEAPK